MLFRSFPKPLSPTPVYNRSILYTSSCAVAGVLIILISFLAADLFGRKVVRDVAGEASNESNSNSNKYFHDHPPQRLHSRSRRQEKSTQQPVVLIPPTASELFFRVVVPDELVSRNWLLRICTDFLQKHSVLSLAGTPDIFSGPLYMTSKWIQVLVHIMALLLLSSLLCSIYYADNGFCNQWESRSDCQAHSVVSLLGGKICSWHHSSKYCYFDETGLTAYDVVFLSVVLMVLVHPIRGVCRVLGDLFMQLLQRYISKTVKANKKRKKKVTLKKAIAATSKFQNFKEDYDIERQVVSEVVDDISRFSATQSHHAPTGTIESQEIHFEADTFLAGFFTPQSAGLVRYQSRQSKLMLAARLVKMQIGMDFSTVDEELVYLQALSDPFYWHSQVSVFPNELRDFLVEWSRSYGDPFSASSVMHYDLRYNSHLAWKHLRASRRESKIILNGVSETQGGALQEVYLAREFFVRFFPFYDQSLLRQELLSVYESNYDDRTFKSFLRLLTATSLLIVIIIGMGIGAVYFGSLIGTKGVNFWMLTVLVSFVAEITLVEPFKIVLESLILSAVIGNNLFHMRQIVSSRAKFIMKRSDGLMCYYNSLIQHFNPACRAARLFPELGVSRFLMSLNDFDIPLRTRTSKVMSLDFWLLRFGDFCSFMLNPFAFLPFGVRMVIFNIVVVVVVGYLLLLPLVNMSTTGAATIVIIIWLSILFALAVGKYGLLGLEDALLYPLRLMKETVVRSWNRVVAALKESVSEDDVVDYAQQRMKIRRELLRSTVDDRVHPLPVDYDQSAAMPLETVEEIDEAISKKALVKPSFSAGMSVQQFEPAVGRMEPFPTSFADSEKQYEISKLPRDYGRGVGDSCSPNWTNTAQVFEHEKSALVLTPIQDVVVIQPQPNKAVLPSLHDPASIRAKIEYLEAKQWERERRERENRKASQA